MTTKKQASKVTRWPPASLRIGRLRILLRVEWRNSQLRDSSDSGAPHERFSHATLRDRVDTGVNKPQRATREP